MRITGGSLTGRRVEVPQGIIRPAMDRMRESVFGILGDLGGCSFLDLFSGSGSIALEAASRGAAVVEAVEGDVRKHKTLIENVGIAPIRITCHCMAVELFVRRAARRVKRPFDYIFCDPPFPYRYRNELVTAIARSPLMAPGSRLLVHRPRQEPPSPDPACPLSLGDSRAYGRSIVDFWVYPAAPG